MAHFRARAEHGFFRLDEVADLRALADHRSRAQPRERTDARAFFHARAFQMRERLHLRAVGDDDARPEDDVRTNDDILTDFRVIGKINRLRIEQRRTVLHRTPPRAGLEETFGFGELHPRIDAEDFLFVGFDDNRGASALARETDNVREVIFALGVVVADLRQKLRQRFGFDSDDAGIAEGDLQLLRARIFRFDDRFKRPVRAELQTTVGARRVRAEAENGDAGARVDFVCERAHGLRLHQRRVGVEHEHGAAGALQRGHRLHHRIARAARRRLHRDRRVGPRGAGALADFRRVIADDDAEPRRRQRRGGGEHVLQHRPAGDRVQHLGRFRAHARALAGGEHDHRYRAFRV